MFLLPNILSLHLFLLVTANNSINTISTTCTVPNTTPFFASSHTSSPSACAASTYNTTNATIFAPLLPPLYHNVTTGEAWVFPSSPYDLGARDVMSCECFDPEGELRLLLMYVSWKEEDFADVKVVFIQP